MKADLRRALLARRSEAAHRAAPGVGTDHLRAALAPFAGAVLAGYMPMRDEIDPLPAMAAHHAGGGAVCVPVITATAAPLVFHRWQPGADMVAGRFGAQIPATPDPLIPQVVIVPLVGFDAQGGRLGYGGGFYDRTLEALRARGPVTAIGFAFDAQEAPALPQEPTDQPLDMIVTPAGLRHF